MSDWFKNIILGLLNSKKFVVMVAGMIVTFAAKYKLNLDTITVETLVAALIAWVIGQGIADMGKEAAKISNFR